MPASDTSYLTWMPAWQIRALIGERKVTPTQVLEHFLARIAALEPTLHAFDVLDVEGARTQAAAATRAVEDGAELGLLHGIPIGIMDICFVKGIANGLLGRQSPAYDEIGVERIRQAGAIIVGTTATYNWPVREGPRNPWNPALDPGNSSRGSAVVVASAMLPLAVGMDGAGSTRTPAAWSGCLGLATTRGLIPYVDYEQPAFRTTSNMGPMARNARDCGLLLQVMAGRDGRDIISTQFDIPDYAANVDDGVEGMDIAWTDDFGWSKVYWLPESAEIVAFVKAAAFGLAESGAKVAQIDDAWEEPMPIFQLLSKHLPGMNPVSAGFDPVAGQTRFEEVWGPPETQAPPLTPPSCPPDLSPAEEYRFAAERRAHMVDTLERVLAKYKVIISATTLLEPRPFQEWGYFGREFAFTSYLAHTAMMNVTGYPAISVPCGLRNGLPVGMQIIGRQGEEDLLLQVARAVEQRYPLPHPLFAR
ncbi:hypothetical protein A8G00_21215 [Sphingobium sp. SA916]|nr:hypothetical protein A8G00_21215 [Sphingobium sp. SA916]